MADEVKSVKDEMNGKSELLPAKWNRFTVADGDWMQSKTLNPLTARDDFLAEQIDKSTTDWQDALSSESATRYSDDQYLSASISSLSGEFYTFSADDYYPTVTALRYDLNSEIERATQAESTLSGRISLEETTRSAEDVKLQNQIDKLKAATDVIAVFGTYDEFVAGSGDLGVTDNDTIKVLRDNNYTPAATDEDYESNDDDGFQVYYEWHDPDAEEPHTDWTGWSAIGSLDPYYSVAEIDEYKDEVASDFASLSATVANNYLSANDTAVSAGKNIIVTNETGPKVGIKTKDDVSFSSVSATGFSGTNLSGLNQHDTIDNLFSSAYSGAEASAWINDNSARLDIQAGYGLETGEDDNRHLVIGLHQERCDYNKYGLALGSWCTAHTYTIGAASFAFGESCVVTGGQGTIAAGSNVDITGRFSCGFGYASDINGSYSYSIGEQNNLTTDRQYAFGQGLSGNSFMIGRYNEVEPDAQFVIGGGTTGAYSVTSHKNLLVIKNDVISARDFSAGNVSLSSLTNISALGNGITNTATFNLSAVKLSAGEGIGFKNDTNGVLSISAEGRAYTGENYVKVDNTTKKIGLSGNLVGSAESGQSAYNWITTKSATLSAGPGIIFSSAGQNTLGISVDNSLLGDYVPTSAVECLIGSGNSKAGGSTGIYLAQGSANGVDGWNSYAFGYNNSAGANSLTLGNSNSAFGESIAQGTFNSAFYHSIAQGSYCSAANNGQAFGSYLSINSGMAIGNYNKTSSNVAFVIGNGVYEPNRRTQSDLFLISSNGLISGDSIKLGNETNSTTSQFFANNESFGFVHSGYGIYQDYEIDMNAQGLTATYMGTSTGVIAWTNLIACVESYGTNTFVHASASQYIKVATAASIPPTLEENVYYII